MSVNVWAAISAMKFSLSSLGRYRHWLSGWAVAWVGLMTTYWLVQQQSQSVAMVQQTRFTQEARAFTDALGQRVAANTEIVYGLHNLFALNPQLERADFERVVSALDAVHRYPGVRNLSFTKRVPRHELAAYEAAVRAELRSRAYRRRRCPFGA